MGLQQQTLHICPVTKWVGGTSHQPGPPKEQFPAASSKTIIKTKGTPRYVVWSWGGAPPLSRDGIKGYWCPRAEHSHRQLEMLTIISNSAGLGGQIEHTMGSLPISFPEQKREIERGLWKPFRNLYDVMGIWDKKEIFH